MAGLFFCLASAECAGLLFLSCCNTAPYKRLQRVLCRQCNLYHQRNKTAHRSLQGLFLKFVPLSRRRYQTDTSGYNTACATLERITAPGRAQQIPDATAIPDAVQVSTDRPIIIRYIRAQGCAPVMHLCQTVQHIADHASPARSAPPHVQGQPGGRRGTTGGYRRSSFRAFAR